MPSRRRRIRKLLKALLPIILLLVIAIGGATAWLVYQITHPPHRDYLVTPEKFTRLSDRGLRATEETWINPDGTAARGWLLRGAEGAPAVIFLHAYGADRSWLFNLGVKLNEATNFTVLWPDLRGHGPQPLVTRTSFGAREAEDVLAAISFLRTLRTPRGTPLVGDQIGLYGVELGAYAAARAGARNPQVRALALDSVPASPSAILHAAVARYTGFSNTWLDLLARSGTRLYLFEDYDDIKTCDFARHLEGREVLLLAGNDASRWRSSTVQLARCLPLSTHLELHDALPLTGLNVVSATGEQGEAYDRRVIEFFNRTLNTPAPGTYETSLRRSLSDRGRR
jgi:hypothetical protein